MGGWRRRWPCPVGALALVLALAAGPGLLPVALRQVGELDAEGVNLLLVFPLLKARPRCVRRVELWLRVLRHHPQFHSQQRTVEPGTPLVVDGGP
jgi:hypothetical protein